MEKITLGQIMEAVAGKLVARGNTQEFSKVVIDSREATKDDIFFSIKGENFDGHDFIKQVIEKGAGLCIVHKEGDYSSFEGQCNIVLVKDTKAALLELSAYYLKTLNIKVVGVTGSTGKTSTKDLIAAALSSKYKVFKTQGNFNNDIGMPLMIFKLDKSYDVAVLEMGMSNLGEIETLACVARQEIAVITNVGTSHLENLKTRENILKAKLEITSFFKEDNVLIVNGDNDLLCDLKEENYKLVKIGVEHDYNFKGCRIIINKGSIEFCVREKGEAEEHMIKVPVPGIHNVLNSLLAIAVARQLNVSYKEIQEGIVKLESTSMRLDVIEEEGYTIINDSYNASPDSMIAAFQVINSYEGRKIAVLGTMKELGTSAKEAHKEVGKAARKLGINKLYTLGEFNDEYKEGFGSENFKAFSEMKDLIENLKKEIKNGDVILVKASRSMKFETIVKELQRKNI